MVQLNLFLGKPTSLANLYSPFKTQLNYHSFTTPKQLVTLPLCLNFVVHSQCGTYYTMNVGGRPLLFAFVVSQQRILSYD